MESRENSKSVDPRSKSPVIVFRPRILGSYSVDQHKNYVPDSSKLKYFIEPQSDSLLFNLDDRRDVSVTKFHPSNEAITTRLSGLLKWIELNREKVKPRHGTDRLLKQNFVSTSGSLIPFLTAPYTPMDQWKVWAAKYKGTIYLRSDNSYDPERFEIDKKYGFWGRKFVQHLVSESPDKPPDTTKPVIGHEEFRCVYTHQFGNHSVLYSAVIKAVVSEKALRDPLPLDELKFIDLRTYKIMWLRKHEKSLKRYKFLMWWANAFLTTTDRVLCGFRDDDGFVQNFNIFTTKEMVEMSEGLWNRDDCIYSYETLLSELERNVVNDCDETIYEFSKGGKTNFTIKEWEPSEENCPVPEWYKESMSK